MSLETYPFGYGSIRTHTTHLMHDSTIVINLGYTKGLLLTLKYTLQETFLFGEKNTEPPSTMGKYYPHLAEGLL